MKRYFGGEPVDEGTYLDLSNFEFHRIDDNNPVLPGNRDKKYFKTPMALAVVAGPVGGLLLVLFLPFVGLVSLLTFIVYRAVKAVHMIGVRLFKPADELEPAPGAVGKEGREEGAAGRQHREH
jgi:hypothetical protein